MIEESRKQVAKAVNIAEVYTKFEIGRFKNRKHCLPNSKHLYSVSQVCFELESQYELYLPEKQELQAKLKSWIDEFEENEATLANLNYNEIEQ